MPLFPRAAKRQIVARPVLLHGTLRSMLQFPFFVSIDFDGTVTETDITDAVIRAFAAHGWEEAEQLWESGQIGSRECLIQQVDLLRAPLPRILEYVRGGYAVDASFGSFVGFLREQRIPFGIVSDGFQVLIETLLAKAGLQGIPVYANQLVASEQEGHLRALFPYAKRGCPAGACKCVIASDVGKDMPIIHIGDGRSDFCLAEQAAYVFSKGRLTRHCHVRGLSHTPFSGFKTIEGVLRGFLHDLHPLPTGGRDESSPALWNVNHPRLKAGACENRPGVDQP